MKHKRYLVPLAFLVIFSIMAIFSQKNAAAKSSAGYRLLGTVSGGRITQGWVFIGEVDSAKEGRWFKLYERLDDGSRIVKIRRGEVVLKKGSKQEILILEGPLIKRAVVSISPTHKIVNRYEALAEMGSLGGLLKLVGVKPYFDTNGDFAFLVDGIEKASIVELAGLKNGDLIKSANGQKLFTPQKAIQIFRKLRNQSQLDVELLRSNRLVKLHYDLK